MPSAQWHRSKVITCLLLASTLITSTAKTQEIAQSPEDDSALVQVSQRQGQLSLQVHDEHEAMNRLERILFEVKGRIRSQRDHVIEFEMPLAHFEEVWRRVKQLGTELDSSQNVVDLSEERIGRSEKGVARIEERSQLAIIRVEFHAPDNRVDMAALASLQLSMLGIRQNELERESDLVAAAKFNLRRTTGTFPMGLAVGFDASLGGGAGLYYESRLLVGLGIPLGKKASLALAPGIGVRGLTGNRIPAALEIPLEFFGHMWMSEEVHWSLWARNSGVLGAKSRKGGTKTIPFVDEFSAGTSLFFAWGRMSKDTYATGPLYAFTYHELMGVRAFEIIAGFGASY